MRVSSLFRRKGATKSASSALVASRDLSQKNGYLELELEATLELARARLDANDVRIASELLSQVIATIERRRLRPLQSIAHASSAELYIALGKPDRALVEIEKSITIASEFDGVRIVEHAEHLRRKIDETATLNVR